MSNLIAILGDTHIGARNGSKIFEEQSRRFFSDVFFPTLHKKKVNQIIQLGDLCDNRKSIELNALYNAHRYFFDRIRKYDFATLVGNHDSYFKHTLRVNSPSLIMRLDTDHGHTIVDCPMHLGAGLFLPWICKDNYEDTMTLIESSSAKYCFAHLELSGFKNNAHVMKDGMAADIFKRFDVVFTGHYHTKQIQDNIMYVGTPYELTWSDYGEDKGFHILDLDTGELEFIKNPYKMHQKITYHEDNAMSVTNVTDRIIRVIVEKKTDQKKFDNFIKYLQDQNPAELKITDSMGEYTENLDETIDLDIDSTTTIIEKYINGYDLMLDKDKLNVMFKELHAEAISL